MAAFAALTGWTMQEVWHTPWTELELVAERLSKQQGKGFKRKLTSKEQAAKAAALAAHRPKAGPT